MIIFNGMITFHYIVMVGVLIHQFVHVVGPWI